jgi:hypothetical protein
MRVPQILIDEVSNNLCIPFIGSGFSKNAYAKNNPIPLWHDLINKMCFELGIDPTSLDNRVDSYLEVAQKFEHEFTRIRLIKFLMKVMPLNEYGPGYVHYLLQELPFTTIITTNYDDLIEKSYRATDKKVATISSKVKLQLYENDSDVTKIIKMHGDFEDSEFLVITKLDYENFFSKNEFIADYLKFLFRSRSILLIGYSRIDPDYNQIIDYRHRLGEYTQRLYIIEFNDQIEQDDYVIDIKTNICTINLSCKNRSYEKALISFFRELINAVKRYKSDSPLSIETNDKFVLPKNFVPNSPGATEESIRELENRYSCRLPSSYKSFLLQSDGGLIIEGSKEVEILGTKRSYTTDPDERKISFEHKHLIPVSYSPMASEWWIYWCFDVHDFYSYDECPIVQFDVWDDNTYITKRFENFTDFFQNINNRFGVKPNV